MLTLKEQLDAEKAEKSKPAPVVTGNTTERPKAPLFGNPYREEYLKNIAAIKEKLDKRGKTARPSRKSKSR